ncbi:hypothetical protein [Paenibacillus lautus]|uniref:hypothetical protein n=1 Tax=Paenibacillus lautus TaxID=1401 RepID=UPI001C7CB64C|nr:hypothetical protein [Paenibacillus lautus]
MKNVEVKRLEIKFGVVCECGNQEEYTLKRDKDPTEDYFSISDNVLGKFEADIAPDTVYINCKNCGKREQITI